jgi:hypothetical protein
LTRPGSPSDEQVADGRLVVDRADELPHHAEPAAVRHPARGRRQVAGDEAQQGRLAGAVRPDERDVRAVADAERHVLQQRPAVGEGVGEMRDVDVAHER